eukprot:TCALIF_03625-PA protein Name:"Protein of unknown function" AED:0.19 eAED:0.81 QI:0/0/0/1/0/0.5/2/0/73
MSGTNRLEPRNQKRPISALPIYGCVAHSHPMERKNICMSTTIKDHTVALLTSWITPEVVIVKYLSTNDMDPES